jgi:phospholipase C
MSLEKTSLLLFGLALLMALAGCQGVGVGPNTNSTSTTTTPNSQQANHIIFMMQENRSFDSYFGKLNDFRSSQALGRDADALDTMFAAPADDGSTVSTFHMVSSCIFNTTAAWLESHGDMNRFSPSDGNPLLLDGFVHTAGAQAKNEGTADTKGVRSMGFYDGNDLNSPYSFATQFSTSDRWYAPAPMQTEAVRLYAMAATSQGFVHPPQESNSTLSATTIFQLLDHAGISWKIYSVDKDSNGQLITSLRFFQPYGSTKEDHIFPISQYFTDVTNGTLPQFAYIEPSFISGLDEHPGSGTNIQLGAQFMSSILTALINSPSWKDSIFIETFDESGGTFDHVGPMISGQAIQELSQGAGGQSVGAGKYPADATAQHVPSPDGIMPKDLHPGDAQGDFTRTGFRVPLIIVSPFAKPHFVSHTPMDYTAVLRFVEKRFNLPNLTQRDAAQPDMAEFFDFVNTPNLNPPATVQQRTGMGCDATKASAASGSTFTPPANLRTLE